MYLNINNEKLQELAAFNTAREISQQPSTIMQVLDGFIANKSEIHSFTQTFLKKPHARIILTGAGTSAFAGNSIANYLKQSSGKRVEAIATTDLVSNPHLYFEKEVPTLIVSFARSGNSPESVEATLLANELVDDCYHLAVTCNKEGFLYKTAQQHENYYAMLMPEPTNDLGFAMTSSFTAMVTATLLAFDYQAEIEEVLPHICEQIGTSLTDFNQPIKQLADNRYSRVIYLGSGDLKALAEECALKLLELTDGNVAVMFDSPLGFRHGPKAFINDDTLVVVLVSNDKHTQKYDLDLINEVRSDNIAKHVITVNAPDSINASVYDFKFNQMAHINDAPLSLLFIVWAQLFSIHASLAHKITTDTPCASGAVNRVVQGVILHQLD